jgi:hypothetical protein
MPWRSAGKAKPCMCHPVLLLLLLLLSFYCAGAHF